MQTARIEHKFEQERKAESNEPIEYETEFVILKRRNKCSCISSLQKNAKRWLLHVCFSCEILRRFNVLCVKILL